MVGTSRGSNRTVRLLLALTVAVAATTAVGPAAATETASTDLTTGATEAFVVNVTEQGDATVALRLTFDLSSDGERRAFEAVDDDRENVSRRFAERIDRVASQAGERTGRSMAVRNATVHVSTDDGGATGVVTIAATWTNLAVVEGDRLTVGAPFASGFEPDRAFVVRGPTGYTFDEANPTPDAVDGRAAAWSGGASLEGFSATFAPAASAADADGDSADGTATSAPTPLPGVLVTALAGAVLLAVRRRATNKD
ncbi:DUF7345 domain-containing protein [Halobaculum marinum]|uniref:DUF7345 domain-containing protein n=1 Tax=Halobaculum marinum TaxID=3031996 RepID=A0ABD5X0J3_9EURY|nr:hypothetical protein [Halobaculum sp. DT55]